MEMPTNYENLESNVASKVCEMKESAITECGAKIINSGLIKNESANGEPP